MGALADGVLRVVVLEAARSGLPDAVEVVWLAPIQGRDPGRWSWNASPRPIERV